MAKSKESFDRRQRERAKKAKADAKRERRLSKDDDEETTTEPSGPSTAEQSGVIDELAALHAQFEDKAITFDDFEARRAELLSRLQVD
jgi:hypothetical protein